MDPVRRSTQRKTFQLGSRSPEVFFKMVRPAPPQSSPDLSVSDGAHPNREQGDLAEFVQVLDVRGVIATDDRQCPSFAQPFSRLGLELALVAEQ